MRGLDRLGRALRRPVDGSRRRPLRAVLSHLRDLGKGRMAGQVLPHKNEVVQDAQIFFPLGYWFRPLDGGEAILHSIGDTGSHVLAMPTADKRIPCPVELKPGEGCLANMWGHYLYIAEDGIYLKAPKFRAFCDDIEWAEYGGAEGGAG